MEWCARVLMPALIAHVQKLTTGNVPTATHLLWGPTTRVIVSCQVNMVAGHGYRDSSKVQHTQRVSLH